MNISGLKYVSEATGIVGNVYNIKFFCNLALIKMLLYRVT